MKELLYEQCQSLIDPTLPNIANISNCIALLYHEMENINCLHLESNFNEILGCHLSWF